MSMHTTIEFDELDDFLANCSSPHFSPGGMEYW